MFHTFFPDNTNFRQYLNFCKILVFYSFTDMISPIQYITQRIFFKLKKGFVLARGNGIGERKVLGARQKFWRPCPPQPCAKVETFSGKVEFWVRE